MKIIYAKKPINIDEAKLGSIFLAGPTPRNKDIQSWRPEAISIFDKLQYSGILFVPEEEYGNWKGTYDDQVEWEELGLATSCCIMFWIPRKIPEMSGFTTNDEWGFWKKSGKVVFGAPINAEKVSYQRYYATKYKVPQFSLLEDTVFGAIQMDLNCRLK